MRRFYTIGYEGADIESFVERLLTQGVTLLADVRQLPLSRKKGFSKRSLEAALRERGIRYAHLPALGDPKPGRDAARDGDLPLFKAIYTNHLKSDGAITALDVLKEHVAADVVCLMCFERDPASCHRTILAARLATKAIAEKVDLYVSPAPDAGVRRFVGPRAHPRESAAAAE